MTDEEVYISLLSSSERIAFVAHLNKRNKRSDTKNIHLFSALVKGKPEEIKLGRSNRHLLRNKLGYDAYLNHAIDNRTPQC